MFLNMNKHEKCSKINMQKLALKEYEPTKTFVSWVRINLQKHTINYCLSRNNAGKTYVPKTFQDGAN